MQPKYFSFSIFHTVIFLYFFRVSQFEPAKLKWVLLKLESTLHSNDESRRFHCCSTVRIQHLLTSVLKQRPKRCYLASSPSSSPNSLPNKPKRDSDSSLKHFPSPVPHCHCSDHRCMWFGSEGGDLQTHWLWHFESTKDIRDGNMCFVLSVSVPNKAINKAEQRSSQSPRSKIRLWLWKHGRFRTPRRERAASWRKHTLYSKVQSSPRVPFV